MDSVIEGSLIEQFHARKGYMKLRWEDLAQRVHKETTTVRKQLAYAANPSLNILEEYAAAMDARLVLLSDDALYDYENSGVPRAQKNLAEMDSELERLKEKLDEKDAIIADYRARLSSTEKMLSESIEAIHHKDERIDALTDKLLSK